MSKINDNIEVIGAREHNLKNFDLSIPKNQLVVFRFGSWCPPQI